MRKLILRRVVNGMVLVMLTGCGSMQVQPRVSSCQMMLKNTFSTNDRIPQRERQALLALDALSPGSIVPAAKGTFPCRYMPSPCNQSGVTCQSGHVTKIDMAYYYQLTGEIPAKLGNLSQLTELHLRCNYLYGEIPPELGNLSSLQMLDLSSNQLSGAIPAELGSLTELRFLYLYGNQLSGEIPPELGKLTRLERLWLAGNQLSGEIPAELGNLRVLGELYLIGNQLGGEIPAELGSLSQLQYLYLGYNQLSGGIPAELGSLSQLQELYLGINQLEGPLPDNMTELPLELLSLSNTELCIPRTTEFEAWIADIEARDFEEVPYCE